MTGRQVSLANITQVADHTITKHPGDTLHLTIQFSYQGPGNWTDTLYVNLYQYTLGIINGVDGWQKTQDVSVTDPALDIPVTKQVTFDYPIPSGRSGGFGIEVSLQNYGDAIYLDVAGHTGCVIIPSQASTITNLTVVSFT
jgi:hypothetical protein